MVEHAHRNAWMETTPPQPQTRCCEWPGCACAGEYRAPRSREALRSYRWFCLEHVRRYNASWNYYAGMSADEIEADVRRDTVWGRPTWRPGTGYNGPWFSPDRLNDDFGLFGEHDSARKNRTNGEQRPAARSAEAKALGVLGLEAPTTVARVRARYRELVKRYHPDANNGDKAAEEKFKEISQAYETVMGSLCP